MPLKMRRRAMITVRTRRVVVGIATTLAGYEALRFAVDLARTREVPLMAVRAYRATRADTYEWRQALAWEANNDVTQAFAEAGGGVPDDIDVAIELKPGSVALVLTEIASDPTDVLVIGGTSRPRPWSGRHAAVARRCSWLANCPVIVVPQPALARAASPRKLKRGAVYDMERYLHTRSAMIHPRPR
jgi:nucleotide-binding universal stress UspA family protein